MLIHLVQHFCQQLALSMVYECSEERPIFMLSKSVVTCSQSEEILWVYLYSCISLEAASAFLVGISTVGLGSQRLKHNIIFLPLGYHHLS
jgi:hypothetical protein